MAAPRLGSGTPRGQAARPLPGASRHAHVLDAAAVHEELDRLWAQVGDAPGRAPVPTNDQAAELGSTDGMLVRANTFNLIAVARSRDHAERLSDIIANLGELYPSRTLILIASPGSGTAPGLGLDVQVQLLEQAAAKGRPAVRFECVTVAADAGATSHLASVTSPLLIAELPDVLWWPGDVPTGDPLFGELTEVVDRLIVDTAIQRDPAASLRFLTSVMAADRCPGLSDFAWARLTPWRHLVAQFFDNLPARQCLAAVEDVRIVYGSQNPDGSSGLSAAVLMAGWLATRLGWQPTGEMTLGRQGWQLALRGQGDRGHQRIDVTLRRTHDASLGCALVGVRLLARGEAPGSFAVERMTPSGLMTASESPTMPHVSRTVYAQLPDDITLLGEELQAFDRDRIYEEALAFAAAILPEGASQEATRP